MGIMDFLRKGRGALDEEGLADDYFAPENVAARNQASGLTNTAPFVPTNPVENRLAKRTMNLVPGSLDPRMGQMPEGQQGPPQMVTPQYGEYISPRQNYRNQVQAALSERMQYQQAELDRKMNNPFFKVTDLIADVARNTIGLPFNMVTGGQAFTYDPDNDARTTTRNRLRTLEDLQFANNNMYMDSLEARGVAMEDATNERRQTEINALTAQTQAELFNKVDTGKFTVESQDAYLAHYLATGEKKRSLLKPNKSLEFMRNPNTNVVEVFQKNPDGSMYRLGDASTIGVEIDGAERTAAAKAWSSAADSWFDSSEKSMQAAASRETRQKTLNDQIAIVRELAPKAAGLGTFLSSVPNTEFKELQQALQTLKGIIGFNELRALKDSGATLGQVAVQELNALQAIQGTLDQGLPADRLLETVDRIQTAANKMEQSIVDHNAVQTMTYGTRGRRAANPYGERYDGPPQGSEMSTPVVSPTTPNTNAGGTYTPSS
jgi:hypothetical protein